MRAAAGDLTVSVIVPVRDRRAMLAELLDALDAQTHRDFELIVVDDASTDGSGELARSTTVAGRAVRVVEGAGRGAVAARIVGVGAAGGDVLAFTDSDCVPDPTWLELALTALADGAELVHGHTRPIRPPRPLERSVASGTEGLFPTCNVFFRRELYERLGGFDPDAAARWRFRPTARARGLGFGEDTLLAWQAVRAGADVRYVPEAVVAHQVFPPDAGEIASRVVQSAAFPGLIKEIPELRQTLMWRSILLGDAARLPLYAAGATWVTRRRGLSLLALTWWALARLRTSAQPARERLPWLPAELVVDAATTGALLVGSISARSPVL